MSEIIDQIELLGNLSEDCQWIHLPQFKAYRRMLSKWQDKDLHVVIKILKQRRSDRQNRYMWGCVVVKVRQWLYETQGEKFTRDEVYTWLRVKLLGEQPIITNIAGVEVISMRGKRFSQMTTKEFAEAVDTIRAKMLKRGLDIPAPGEGKTKHNFIDEFISDD